MDVRVCGPNLRDQSKGSYHVHEANCRDLHRYGPGKPEGGDYPGTSEMLVQMATKHIVVKDTYGDIIDEYIMNEDATDEDDAVAQLMNDFWFAPCCASLQP